MLHWLEKLFNKPKPTMAVDQDAHHIRHLWQNLNKNHQVFRVVMAIAIGILAAYGAILFRFLIHYSHLGFFGYSELTMERLATIPWYKRLINPALGGLFVGIIVARFSPEVKGSGIPEVMESVSLKGGIIRVRVLITKAIAAALTIGSGGSAGREGPIVHIGSAIGSTLGQLFQLSAKHIRTFVACGAAAAIAATFNAPIAGALFAMEVILRDMSVVSLSPIVIASVIATVISRHHLGDFPAFQVPGFEFKSAFELIPYSVLGILAAGSAVLFIRCLRSFSDFFDRNPMSPWLKPMLGGLLVGIIGLGFPQVFGVGYESINQALWFKTTPWILFGILIAKILATSLSLGSGGSGGIFAPSLVIGSALGALVGAISQHFFPAMTAHPGAYALVGMGALVAGATHAPIAAILIIFEMTNDYQTIPPLMISCVLAVLVSSWIQKESVYTTKLAKRGITLFKPHDVNLLKTIKVRDVMMPNPDTIPVNLNFSDVLHKLLEEEKSYTIVVDDQSRYVGTISLNDIKEVLPQADILEDMVCAIDVTNEQTPFVLPEDSLDLVMHLFGKHHETDLVVCDSQATKKVIGLITRSDVITEYNKRIFEEDLTGGFSSIISRVGAGRSIEILGGIFMAEIDISSKWIGKSIRQINLRQEHGLEIVLVHRQQFEPGGLEGRPAMFPAPNLLLQPGDKLLVVGEESIIRSFRS